MRRQQFIKPAHIWMVAVLIACGLWVVAGKAGIAIEGQQNSNQNSNSNGNANSNTNTGQNNNANTTANANARGEQTGMANLSSRDREFIMEAAMGSMLEVELGRIAAQQGASDSVKQFGQMMVDHHQKANQELMTLASNKGITLPTALGEKHQRQMTKLQGMSGAEFDREYSKLMVKEHREAVDDFEDEISKGSDPDLKAFAGKALPNLQEHLRMARTLEGQHGGGNRNNNSNSNSNNNNNSNRP